MVECNTRKLKKVTKRQKEKSKKDYEMKADEPTTNSSSTMSSSNFDKNTKRKLKKVEGMLTKIKVITTYKSSFREGVWFPKCNNEGHTK